MHSYKKKVGEMSDAGAIKKISCSSSYTKKKRFKVQLCAPKY